MAGVKITFSVVPKLADWGMGEPLELSMDNSDTISDIKQQIYEVKGIYPSRMILFLRNKEIRKPQFSWMMRR